MKSEDKTRTELIDELRLLHKEHDGIKALYESDITGFRIAEDKLKISEEKYRVLFTGSSNGILAIDVETHRFLFSNPSICELFGYTDEEFQQLGIENIVPEESLGFVMSEFESQVRGEKSVSFTIPCRR